MGVRGFHHNWQLYCLFNSRYRNTWIKSARLRTSIPLWGGTTGDLWNIHYIHIVSSTPHTCKMKENIKIPHYWSLVGRQNWWPIESPHKVPAMPKALINHAIPGLRVFLLFVNIMETTLTQERKVISHHWKLYCYFNIPYWKTQKKHLTHLPLDKMQTIFSTTFYWMKILEFRFKFTEICSYGPNWQSVSTGSGNGLAPTRRQAIIWTNADLVQWRIYAALGGDELSFSYQCAECWPEARIKCPQNLVHINISKQRPHAIFNYQPLVALHFSVLLF